MSVGAAATTPAQESTNAGAAAANSSATGAAAPALVPPPAAATPPAAVAAGTGTEGAAVTPPAGTEAAAAVVPGTPVVPENYELKIPDGSIMTPESLKGIEAFAKAKGLSNEAAQTIVDHQNSELAAYQARRDGWLEELKNDKELGGDALPRNAELAKRIIEKYGNEDLKKIANETGIGNHPAFFRLLVRMGKAAGEDVLDTSGSQGGGAFQNEAATNMYGKTKY